MCDDGVVAINECFKHNKILEVLNIAGNNIVRHMIVTINGIIFKDS